VSANALEAVGEARDGWRSIVSGDEQTKVALPTKLADESQKVADDIRSWKSASPDAQKELLENLKEAIRLLQRYMMASLTAAGAFAALAWAPVDVVPVVTPLPVPISRGAGLLLLGSVYFVMGLLAVLILARAERILRLLKQSTEPFLIRAVLMYPSIPTMKTHGPRVGLCLLPPVFVIAGITKIFGKELLAVSPVFGLLMLCFSHFQIAYNLRRALGGELPDFHGD
jgi:hypothetical protein